MQFFEKAKSLANTISLYKAYSRNNATSATLTEIWGAAYFYASILAKSYLSEMFLIDETDLQKLAKEFEAESGYQIDLQFLFEKAWLRVICGTVEIPKIIKQAIHQLERIEPMLGELKFFASLRKEQLKAINSFTVPQSEAEAYCLAHTVNINLQTAEKVLFKVGIDGKVEIYDTGLLQFIADNIYPLRFLAKLQELRNRRKLFISKEEFDQVHQTHKAYFPNTPELEHFIEKKIFTFYDTAQVYHIDPFRQNNEKVKEEVAVLLWNQIISDNRFSSDIERLQFWYYRTVYYSNGFNTLSDLSGIAAARFRDAALELLHNETDITTGDLEYRKLTFDSHNCQLQQIMHDT